MADSDPLAVSTTLQNMVENVQARDTPAQVHGVDKYYTLTIDDNEYEQTPDPKGWDDCPTCAFYDTDADMDCTVPPEHENICIENSTTWVKYSRYNSRDDKYMTTFKNDKFYRQLRANVKDSCFGCAFRYLKDEGDGNCSTDWEAKQCHYNDTIWVKVE